MLILFFVLLSYIFQDLEYELRRRIPVSEQGNTYVGTHLSSEDVHKSSQLSPHKHDSSSDGSRCLAGVHQVNIITLT